jgi:hypothetical protein
MNNASFLLYVSDIMVGVQGLLGFFAFLALVGIVIVGICTFIGNNERIQVYKVNGKRVTSDEYYTASASVRDWDYENKFLRSFPKATKWNFLTIPLFLLLAFSTVLIPSKNTILAIAASEFTEDFLSSPASDELKGLADDTLKLLRKAIKDQVGE